jgi:hypothetical protein
MVPGETVLDRVFASKTGDESGFGFVTPPEATEGVDQQDCPLRK